jgi:hypothetical protein
MNIAGHGAAGENAGGQAGCWAMLMNLWSPRRSNRT